MNKHLKISFFIFCFTLPLLLWGGYQNAHRILSMSRGNYFFEQTKNNAHIAAFRLQFADNKTITLEKNDGLWRVKEADGYYADFIKINSFMKLIFQTTIYRADYIDSKQISTLTNKALSITSLDKSGNIIDSALISPKSEHNKFHYAAMNKQNILFQINGSFNLSSVVTDWVQLPLLAIPHNDIKFIHNDKFDAYRNFPADTLKLIENDKAVPQAENLIDALWYLSPIEIKHAVHFKHDDYNMKKKYEITTFSGLIYELNLFYNSDEYWMSITPRAANIISSLSQRFLDENLMLYDGWFFRLTPSTGEIIANFSI